MKKNLDKFGILNIKSLDPHRLKPLKTSNLPLNTEHLFDGTTHRKHGQMLLDAFESLCHIYLHCNNLCLIELHHVVKLEPSRIFYNDLLQIVLNQPICSMHATANEEA